MLAKFVNFYKKAFNIKEIEDSNLLQYLYFSVLFSYFVTFNIWISSNYTSISTYLAGKNICPPYFPTCGQYYFLQDLPFGYTNGYFYVSLFLILGLGVIFAIQKDWTKAHLMMLVAFVWKVIWVFFLTYGLAGNYDYYDLGLGFVLLFLAHKEYFAKLTFVWFYFMAATIKIDEGWIFGNYFEALITGAPLFPAQIVPLLTNIVILMQIIGAWFLFSKNKTLQHTAFYYFLAFHIYSGIIVNYRYISISIVALVILFGSLKFIQHENFEIKKISKKTLIGYGFLLVLMCGQFIGILIPGNQKKTLEGNYWGLYMFEAAHQCISSVNVTIKNPDGTVSENPYKQENHIANNRCDPYMYWRIIKNQCEKDGVEKVAWTFDHSINGNKYERIVDVSDACVLTYKTFGHNDWIKLDGEAQILEKPVYKTGYLEYLDVEAYAVPASPIVNNYLLKLIENFYKILWLIVLLTLIFLLMKKTFTKIK